MTCSPLRVFLSIVEAIWIGFLAVGCASSNHQALHTTDRRPLCNGENLDGWEVHGGSAEFRVEEGMIVGRTVEGSPNTFLCTKREYGDFELELSVMCDVPLNSGVQIRSRVYREDTPQASDPRLTRQAGEVYGYQCEITRQSRGTAGNFWDEARYTKWLDNFADKPAAQEAYKDAQWNHLRIVAQGDHIRSWVNGVPCADIRDGTDAEGFIGLQVHGIPGGTGPYEVRWKDIYLRELKRGEKVP